MRYGTPGEFWATAMHPAHVYRLAVHKRLHRLFTIGASTLCTEATRRDDVMQVGARSQQGPAISLLRPELTTT